MSIEHAREFLLKLKVDKKFAEGIRAENWEKAARDEGYIFSREEFDLARQELREELSDDELEAVAGGGGCYSGLMSGNHGN